MSSDSLPAALRRDRMAALVQERGFIRVAELSRVFRTSPVTIRTDLDELAARDLVRRVHGGAVPKGGPTPTTIVMADDDLAAEHARLGVAAAGHVQSGHTVVLAAAAVTRAVARALVNRPELTDVSFITNDLRIALELQPMIPRISVLLTGGTLRADSPGLGDPFGGLLLDDVAADLSIVGCGGFSAERGLTEGAISGVEMSRRLLRAGERTIVVAHSTQVGVTSPARVARAEDIDLVVTGDDADPGQVAALRTRGLEVELIE
jgi:DeoR family transcriptional regulator, aga operon transcriptional repressor